jgi:hypothetical protein
MRGLVFTVTMVNIRKKRDGGPTGERWLGKMRLAVK